MNGQRTFCSIFVCWLVTIKEDCVDFICRLTKQFLIEIWKIRFYENRIVFLFSNFIFRFRYILFVCRWPRNHLIHRPQIQNKRGIFFLKKCYNMALFVAKILEYRLWDKNCGLFALWAFSRSLVLRFMFLRRFITITAYLTSK